MSLRVSEEEYRDYWRRVAGDAFEHEIDKRIAANKYHNKKITFNGETFDSKAEARRWIELRFMQKAGQIAELRRQVPFAIDIAGMHICKYIADFVYMKDGNEVVEDVKGVRTPVYRLKRKLVEAVHGVRIKEVTSLGRKE